MRWKLDSILANVAALVAIFTATTGVTAWIFDVFGVGKQVPSLIYWILLFGLGIWVPTSVLFLIALFCELRKIEGIPIERIVYHWFEVCFTDIGAVAVDMRREKGLAYSRSRRATAETLGTYLKFCKSRFDRDRELLRKIDPRDSSGLRDGFASVKRHVLSKCDEAFGMLINEQDNDASKVCLQRVGDLLQGCLDLLDQKMNELASRNSFR